MGFTTRLVMCCVLLLAIVVLDVICADADVPIDGDSEVDKRFVGRWKNANYRNNAKVRPMMYNWRSFHDDLSSESDYAKKSFGRSRQKGYGSYKSPNYRELFRLWQSADD